ncbi:MAG: outer membrane lipoprotein carrier protein LolA [Pseudomonadota bacterium]
MERRDFIGLTAAAMAVAPGLALAQQVPLNALSQYLNQLDTVQARFVQVNEDGSQSTGTLYIRRPGRARFEYYPPDASLVMAGGGQVAIFDNRSNSKRPEQYPLRRTPLSLILERQVDLARREMIVDHFGDAETTTLVAQDPSAPENGRLEIVFSNSPVQLAEWTVVDGGGSRTRVVLQGLETGVRLPARLFNIVLETESRGG